MLLIILYNNILPTLVACLIFCTVFSLNIDVIECSGSSEQMISWLLLPVCSQKSREWMCSRAMISQLELWDSPAGIKELHQM